MPRTAAGCAGSTTRASATSRRGGGGGGGRGAGRGGGWKEWGCVGGGGGHARPALAERRGAGLGGWCISTRVGLRAGVFLAGIPPFRALAITAGAPAIGDRIPQ